MIAVSREHRREIRFCNREGVLSVLQLHRSEWFAFKLKQNGADALPVEGLDTDGHGRRRA